MTANTSKSRTVTTSDLLERIELHLRIMAPHARGRTTACLLSDAMWALRDIRKIAASTDAKEKEAVIVAARNINVDGETPITDAATEQFLDDDGVTRFLVSSKVSCDLERELTHHHLQNAELVEKYEQRGLYLQDAEAGNNTLRAQLEQVTKNYKTVSQWHDELTQELKSLHQKSVPSKPKPDSRGDGK